jgi:hypothetical protein
MARPHKPQKVSNIICDARSRRAHVSPLFSCVPHRFNCNTLNTTPAALLARRLPCGFQNNQVTWKTCAKFMLWARLVETLCRVVVTLLGHVSSPSGCFLSLLGVGVHHFHLIDGSCCTHYTGDLRMDVFKGLNKLLPRYVVSPVAAVHFPPRRVM